MKQKTLPKSTFLNPVTILVSNVGLVKKRLNNIHNWHEKWYMAKNLNASVDFKKERKKMLNKKYYFFKNKRKKSVWWAVVAGLFIGFINGFWGGGGGMVCVPTLSHVFALPEKKAHATAILVILPLSIASFAVYALQGNLEFQNIWYIGGGFFLGGVVGALVLSKMNNVILQLIFGVIIIVAGIRLVW